MTRQEIVAKDGQNSTEQTVAAVIRFETRGHQQLLRRLARWQKEEQRSRESSDILQCNPASVAKISAFGKRAV